MTSLSKANHFEVPYFQTDCPINAMKIVRIFEDYEKRVAYLSQKFSYYSFGKKRNFTGSLTCNRRTKVEDWDEKWGGEVRQGGDTKESRQLTYVFFSIYQ
ncbi:hypothetical protein M0804_003709 [Polistes exclamans]|nr:hypothetical protein M0804_003709 [Polistes exclamans]